MGERGTYEEGDKMGRRTELVTHTIPDTSSVALKEEHGNLNEMIEDIKRACDGLRSIFSIHIERGKDVEIKCWEDVWTSGMSAKENMDELTDEETFNLGFKTPYKSTSARLAAYNQGVSDGAQAQLDKDQKACQEKVEKVIKFIRSCYNYRGNISSLTLNKTIDDIIKVLKEQELK